MIDIEMPASIKKIFDDRKERENRILQAIPHLLDHLKADVGRWQADYDQYGRAKWRFSSGRSIGIPREK
jgi:hypothetical protein